MLQDFFQAFFSLFVIMNIFSCVPIYWILSSKLKPIQKHKSAMTAALVAGALLLIFLFIGNAILRFFNISIVSIQIAGGIILMLIGIRMVLGIHFAENRAHHYEFAAVPIATPLITGPGVITTTILLVQKFGTLITLAAALVNIFVAWLILRYSDTVHKFFGKQGADILARIMGLIICALAVEFIIQGLAGI